MLKGKLNIKIKRPGLWRSIHIALGALVVTMVVIFVLALVIPVRLQSDTRIVSGDTTLVLADTLQKVLQNEVSNTTEFPKRIRSGLFKAPTPLRDKPIADKTIERIRSQLKLQCIMELSGERVAYVNIKGAGLKRCKVGDSVNDLFTVLDVSANRIEISIVGHKTSLSL